MASHSALAVEASGLVKAYGKTRAVDGVDLAVAPSMVYGLLGLNGAGKTTTIRILATLLRPDAGNARVFGHDIVAEADAVRGRVALTGQSNIFVDPQTMPGWLQAFIDVNPVSHLVTAARGLTAGTAIAGQVGWVLAASAALTAIFAPLTTHLYRNQR